MAGGDRGNQYTGGKVAHPPTLAEAPPDAGKTRDKLAAIAGEAPDRVMLWREAALWRRVAHDPAAGLVARADAAAKLADVLAVLAWRTAPAEHEARRA